MTNQGDRVREGELEFDFSAAIASEKLDERGQAMPHGMPLADFVVEEKDCVWLVEVKDPSAKPKGMDEHAARAVESERRKFLDELGKDTLIHQRLVPKARNSYLFLHLMGRDDKPMRFVFLLGAKYLNVDPRLLLNFKDRLLGRIRQETEAPWKKQYVEDCLVLTEELWRMMFPNYSLERIE